MIYYNNIISLYPEYNLSLIILNIYVYVFLLINLFLLMFLFDLKYIKTISELKFFSNSPLVSIFFVLILLSFAGIPPLLGFLSKFLMFLFIFYKKNFLLIFVFLFINMFSIYFYIQNLKFLISKTISNKFNYKNSNIYLNKNIIFFLNFLNFFNIFSLFYLEELVLYFNFLSSNIFI